ncbi:hypothetical protein CBS101457_001003 [Exobasidium rhododendri]|nr:hypothetical protein CBS101457_001003 [Exobasidium rhododendri]
MQGSEEKRFQALSRSSADRSTSYYGRTEYHSGSFTGAAKLKGPGSMPNGNFSTADAHKNECEGFTSPQDPSYTIALNKDDRWSVNSAEEKSSKMDDTYSNNKGPLDITMPSVLSPVISADDSYGLLSGVNRTSRREGLVQSGISNRVLASHFDAEWTPMAARHNVFDLSTNHHLGVGDTMRDDDTDRYGHAVHRSDSMEAHDATYKDLTPSSALFPNRHLRQDMNCNQVHKTQTIFPSEADYGFDRPFRSATSAAMTPTLDRMPYSLHSDGAYRPYQTHHLGMDNGRSAATEMAISSPSEFDEEYSIFVGDLCPELREEDLVAQFLHPSAWPASHPLAIAHAHAQQVQGNFSVPAKSRPSPFTSTKSAKIMTDPQTGASRGFGFVRFSREADCARALIEMQGMVIHPSHGIGRPLRVCTATPKNRVIPATPSSSTLNTVNRDNSSLTDTLKLHQQFLLQQQNRLRSAPNQPLRNALSERSNTLPFSPVSTTANKNFLGYPSSDSSTTSASAVAYSNSALDPNNTTVFVGGLSSLISEDTLKTFFAPFGEIIYVKIPPGKGCGFVQFVQKQDAERAIERMQGFPIGGGRIRLSWGRSQGDKAAAAAAQAMTQASQLTQYTSLTDFGALTPAQLNHLANLSFASNGDEATSANSGSSDASLLLLRRLAANAAAASVFSPTHSSALERRHEQSYDVSAEAMRHLPLLEQQHRQAQYSTNNHHQQDAWKSLDQQDYERDSLNRPYASQQWQARDECNGYESGDYLASLLPSLHLEETSNSLPHPQPGFKDSQPKPTLQQTGLDSFSALLRDREFEKALASGEKRDATKSLKDCTSFSPFSPTISPTLDNDLPLPKMNDAELHRSFASLESRERRC